MEITFLGTGTSMGVPVIACPCPVCHSIDKKDKRLRTSVMIHINDKTLVIDAGPDFRQQMLTNQVTKLHALLITHSHKDHVAGIDDVRAFNYFMNRPMDIYGSKLTLEAITNEYPYIFSEDKYPGIPNVQLNEIGSSPFTVEGINVTPLMVSHLNMPVTAFRIGSFTYITDANYIDKNELKKAEGSEILVINALRKKKHLSHFNLSEAIEIIQKVNPKKAYITHISHQLGKYEDIENELPDNIHMAYDGLKLFI